jgi:hypothetical protein
MDDILIVAPYNAQVGAIQELLPHARVGTTRRRGRCSWRMRRAGYVEWPQLSGKVI